MFGSYSKYDSYACITSDSFMSKGHSALVQIHYF